MDSRLEEELPCTLVKQMIFLVARCHVRFLVISVHTS